MSDSESYSSEKITQVIEALHANTDAVLKMAQAMFMLADALIEPEGDPEPDQYLDGSTL